jgi:exopolysaccharide biosynthesis protein
MKHVKNARKHVKKIYYEVIAFRVAIIFFSIVLIIAYALFRVLFTTFLGPSRTARDVLTLSLLEMSAGKHVPGVFLSGDVIDKIVSGNAVIASTEISDTMMITPYTQKPDSDGGASLGEGDSGADHEWDDYPEGIRMETIRGSSYRGYIMIIRDPSRIYTATSSDFKSGQPGLKILEAVEKEGAVAAINGGGFPDDAGLGEGSLPLGMCFSKGEKLWGSENTVYPSVMGFNQDNVLIVGNLSPAMAKELGIRDAINFGPTLIVNGEPAEVTGLNGSLNPRSAIGQRADGAVIFLCVDGRMASSLGATFSDLIAILQEYKVVNAANLDGGSSSHLVYHGEIINISSSIYGPRRIPTFFMVREL